MIFVIAHRICTIGNVKCVLSPGGENSGHQLGIKGGRVMLKHLLGNDLRLSAAENQRACYKTSEYCVSRKQPRLPFVALI